MAKKSHVPKFGNWDGDDNVPYTAYFDSARKDKAGGVMINPNDPEQNPEAFRFGGGGYKSESPFRAFQSIPLQNNSNKFVSSEKNLSRKSITLESDSDKSSSDHSVLPPNHRHTRSDRKKSMTEANNFYPPSPGPNQAKNGHNLYDDLSIRSASVPIFGQWDEKDPKSGEGFTVIFNKVKEEKHITASKFPPIPMQPNNHTNTQTKDSRSRRCCSSWFLS